MTDSRSSGDAKRCTHWLDTPVPTHRAGLTALGGCPYCEIEQLRHAIRKVRAHTVYQPHCPRELLEGLLASIFRIADAAEHGAPSPETPDWSEAFEKEAYWTSTQRASISGCAKLL